MNEAPRPHPAKAILQRAAGGELCRRRHRRRCWCEIPSLLNTVTSDPVFLPSVPVNRRIVSSTVNENKKERNVSFPPRLDLTRAKNNQRGTKKKRFLLTDKSSAFHSEEKKTTFVCLLLSHLLWKTGENKINKISSGPVSLWKIFPRTLKQRCQKPRARLS